MADNTPKWVKWMWLSIGAIVLIFCLVCIKTTFDKMWYILDHQVQIEQSNENPP